MGKTRNGIYYDFSETEYSYRFEVMPGQLMIFWFSSPLNLKKFGDRLQGKIRDAQDYVAKRYLIQDTGIYTRFLGAIAAYNCTENRGFRITWEGRDWWRISDMVLPGPKSKTTV